MSGVKRAVSLGTVISALILSGCLSGGGGGGSSKPAPAPSEPLTEQQKRIQDGFFVIDESRLPFDALGDAYAGSSRWHGVLNGAGYRVEVPENWNGMLVMYAHGYRGEVPDLTVDNPPMRQYLLDKDREHTSELQSRENLV